MRWTHVCPLLGLALFACATAENDNPLTPGLTAGGSSDEAGSGGSGGSQSGGSDSQAGASKGGTFSTSGGNASVAGFSSGGTFGTSGSGSGGTAGASGGGNAGGAAAGAAGMGGKGNGGAAGAGGGGGNPQCAGITIPAKTSWKGAALESSNDFLPAMAFDGDITTRYATGDPQDGDEWLEIDFGEIVTLNEITLHTNNNDFFRHYELRLSNKEQDLVAPVLSEGDGKTGSIVVPLAQAQAGRYLNIRQTGMVSPTWWSLHEVSVGCK